MSLAPPLVTASQNTEDSGMDDTPTLATHELAMRVLMTPDMANFAEAD